jgi:hypothetical protein
LAGGMKEESPARWAAGAAAPAPAVRRRENLRSASFRDYAMAGLSPAPCTLVRKKRDAGFALLEQVKGEGAGGLRS